MRARIALSLAAALMVCALSASGVAAIHEDQLGRHDWYRQYLGRYRAAEFAKKSARVAVASEQNALAALNLRTGDVEWRQIFGEADPLREIVTTDKPAALFSLSGAEGNQMLRAWNLHSGALVWDRVLCDEAEGAPQQPPVNGGLLQMGPDQTTALGRSLIFVTACGQMQAINSSTAGVEWTYTTPPQATAVSVYLHPFSTSLTVVAVVTSGDTVGLEAATVSALDGSVLSSSSIEVPEAAGPLAGASLAVLKSSIAVLSADGAQLCTAPLDPSATCNCQPVSEALPSTTGAGAITLAKQQPRSALLFQHQQGGDTVFTLAAMKPGAKVEQLVAVGGFSAACPLSLEGGGEVIGFAGADAEGVRWSVVDAATGETVHSEAVERFHGWGRAAAGGGATGLDACFLATYTSKDGGTGWRMLVAASDAAAALLQQREAVWAREEALAGVVACQALDFPKYGGVEGGNAGLAPMQHLRKQILTLKVQMGVAAVEEAAELSELRLAGSDKMLSTPDSAGFRKLLVVLTAAGKLLALHNGDGHVVWSLSFGVAAAPQVLRLWQEPHSLKVSPKVMVMRMDGDRPGYSVVDAHTGKEVDTGALAGPVAQLMALPHTLRVDAAEQRMFLAIRRPAPGAFRAQLLPATPAAVAAFQPHAASTVFWTAEQAPVPAVRGFALLAPEAGGAEFEAVEIWSLVFDATESVLAATQRSDGSVHSRVKVLGDRTMLVKYLNRNTLFLATGPKLSAAAHEASELTVHIIDTVTGRHHFRQVHKGAAGPVAVAMAENWAVYHYWSTTHLRYEVAVIELYDDTSARSMSLADAVLSNSSALVSSHDATAIKTLRQVFFLNMGVKAMAVTDTARGITGKQLLIATSTDQVYALDKRFLDPRRPLGNPTPMEKEERLMPYKADLGVSPFLYATYDKAVAQLRGIDTFPTTLESSSLMFAYGMDLFYTRLAPSKNFDMLDDGFSYALLVVTLLVMAGLGVYLQITKARNELAKKWA
eukprot:jgi/Tetstr1/429479/TSEL_019386.t1